MDTNQLRVNTTELAGPKLQKLQQIGTGAAVIGGLLAAVGYFLSPARFFEAYLHAYMFWISVTVGSLGLLMLHHVVQHQQAEGADRDADPEHVSVQVRLEEAGRAQEVPHGGQ